MINKETKDLEGEVWKEVVGYEGIYEVSNMGRIKSLDRFVKNSHMGKDASPKYIKGQIMTPSMSNGYHTISASNNRISIRTKVHRIVAMAFCEKKLGKDQVNHKNGIKTDNRADNLEWVNQSENMQHAMRNGLSSTNHLKNHQFKKGQKAHNSTIVLHIETGIFYTSREAALLLGVEYGTFKSWMNGRRPNKSKFIST